MLIQSHLFYAFFRLLTFGKKIHLRFLHFLAVSSNALFALVVYLLEYLHLRSSLTYSFVQHQSITFTVPTVGYIFYGRSGQEHLQLQMKVMHTRVMG